MLGQIRAARESYTGGVKLANRVGFGRLHAHSGALLASIISMDDLVKPYFIAGADVTILPMSLFPLGSYLRFR